MVFKASSYVNKREKCLKYCKSSLTVGSEIDPNTRLSFSQPLLHVTL